MASWGSLQPKSRAAKARVVVTGDCQLLMTGGAWEGLPSAIPMGISTELIDCGDSIRKSVEAIAEDW